jgi:quinolinate synthase
MSPQPKTNQELARDLVEMKRSRDCLILAHNYVDMEIQQIADYVGDSLQMAQYAALQSASRVLVCSIRIMGETVKLLNPGKKVLMAHPTADCCLAEMQTPEDIDRLLLAHPGAEIVTYVNSAARLRAKGTITCTSANCIRVVESLSPDREVIFLPDRNIGLWVEHKTGRRLILPDSYCGAHHKVTRKDVEDARNKYPDHTLLVHPECRPEVCLDADIVCSTSQMIDYAESHDNLIIGTETGLLAQLRHRWPDKHIVPLSESMVCRDMRKITIKGAYEALSGDENELVLPISVHQGALLSLNRMLALPKA